MPEASKFPVALRRMIAWLVALAAIWAWSLPAAAQDIPDAPRFGSENMAVSLYSDGQLVAGETTWYFLHFMPSGAEWHGYWKNPGDAGQGMNLVMPVPEDWEVGEPIYPVPGRLLISGLMNHVYKGPYTVMIPVKVGPSVNTLDMDGLYAYVEYLACTDRICVPQDSIVKQQRGGDFARWRAQIAPLLDATAVFTVTPRALRLAIPLPQSVALTDPHVFIEQDRLVQYAAPQTFRRDGDMLLVDIPADERAKGAAPAAVSGILAFGDGAGVRFEARPGSVPGGGTLVSGGSATPPLWTLIFGALVGGLLLNIMPCVFPILSLKALSLARAGESERQARIEGLAYTAGVVFACLVLGGAVLALRAAGEQVGWAFQLQSPAVVVALLVLATAITANFAGLFELPGLPITTGGKSSAFATGLLAAFVATPCTGPFMAAALGAALLLPTTQALLLFAMLGLGLALPFLLIGFVPALRRRLPRPGPWMARFRKFMAVPMGLTALALLWLTVQIGGRGFGLFALVTLFGIVLALMVVGGLQRAGKMAWPAFALVAAPFLIFGAFALPSSYEEPGQRAKASIHAPQTFNRAALAEARESGKPVFLWFTADWCVSCKVNESVAIERESVRKAFEKAGVVTMVGDWTVRDEEIASFLSEQGAAGVPLYLWYDPNAAPEQLPQVLTPDMLIRAAEDSGKP